MEEQFFQMLKTKAVEELFRIGRCYERGDGVDKDEAEAVKWYRMAAEQRHAEAQFELGKCYTFGIGVRKNRAMASKWIRKAAEHWHVKAMLMLGSWLRSGYGGAQNSREAVKWLRVRQTGATRGRCSSSGSAMKTAPA